MLPGTEYIANEFRRAYRRERRHTGGDRDLDGRLAWMRVRGQVGDTIAYCHVMQDLVPPSDLCDAYRRIQALIETRRERSMVRSEAA